GRVDLVRLAAFGAAAVLGTGLAWLVRAAGSARRRWSAVPPQAGDPQAGDPHTQAAHTEAPRAGAPGAARTPRIEPAAARQTPESPEPLPPGVPANWRSGPRSRPYRG